MKLKLPLALIAALLACFPSFSSAQTVDNLSVSSDRTQSEALMVTDTLTVDSGCALTSTADVTADKLAGTGAIAVDADSKLTITATESRPSDSSYVASNALSAGTMELKAQYGSDGSARAHLRLDNSEDGAIQFGATVLNAELCKKGDYDAGVTLGLNGTKNASLGNVTGNGFAAQLSLLGNATGTRAGSVSTTYLSIDKGSDLTVSGDVTIGDETYGGLTGGGKLNAEGQTVTLNTATGTNNVALTAENLILNCSATFQNRDEGGLNINHVTINEGTGSNAGYKYTLRLSSTKGTHIGSATLAAGSTLSVSSCTNTSIDSVSLSEKSQLTLDSCTEANIGDVSGNGTLQISGYTPKSTQLGNVNVSLVQIAEEWDVTAQSVKAERIKVADTWGGATLTATGQGDAIVSTALTSSDLRYGSLIATEGNIRLSGKLSSAGAQLSAEKGTIDLTGLTASYSGGTLFSGASITAQELRLNDTPDEASTYTALFSNSAINVGALSGDLILSGGAATDTVHHLGDISGTDTDITLQNRAKATATSLNIGESSSVTVSGSGSSLAVSGDVAVAEGGTINVTTAGMTVGGTFTNEGTVTVDLSSGGSFEVGNYVNRGDSTVKTSASATCRFGNLDLGEGGSMKLTGSGALTLGGGETSAEGEAPTTTFSVSGETTSSNIDISALGGANFTVAEDAAFTLAFDTAYLAEMELGDTMNFTLSLIVGSGTSPVAESELESLLARTDYSFATAADAIALVAELELEALEEGLPLDYMVQEGSAHYELIDNANGGKDLVWSGTVVAIEGSGEAVPEPTTATLSLLALAALAARRRRKA